MATSGSSNLQHSTFVRHESSAEHRAASITPHQAKKMKLCIEHTTSQVSNTELALFRTVYMLSKEEMAQRKFKPIMILQKANGVEGITSEIINMHNRKITGIETAISDFLIEELDNIIRQSPYISLLIDESTDITITKKMIIFVKLFNNGKQEVHFWSNLTMTTQCTADNIARTILNFLEKKNVPLTKVLGFGTDGASVMMGPVNGVGAQLTRDNPLMLHIHCVAHKLALAVSQAAESVSIIVKTQDNINALYKHFNSSSIRHCKLKEIQSVLQQQQISLKHQHTIRWLSLGKAVEAIHRSYDSIIIVLSEEAADLDEKRKKPASDKSAGLLKAASDYSFISIICLLRDVLCLIDKLSQSFQSNELSFSSLVDRLDVTKARLSLMKTEPGPNLKAFLTDFRTNGGYYKDIKVASVLHSESTFEKAKDKFLTCLDDNLNKRFQKETMEMFVNFDMVLNPSAPPSNLSPDQALENLIGRYCDKKWDQLYKDSMPEEEALREEWFCLKPLLQKYKGMKMVDFCQLISETTETAPEEENIFVYPQYRKLLIIGLTLPLSTAVCERGFSTQNRIKSKKRVRLGDAHVETLTRLSCEGPPFYLENGEVNCDLRFDQVIKKWKKK